MTIFGIFFLLLILTLIGYIFYQVELNIYRNKKRKKELDKKRKKIRRKKKEK